MQTISPAERETAIVANKLAVADTPVRCFFGCFFDCVATILSSLATDLRFVGYPSTLGRNLRSLRASFRDIQANGFRIARDLLGRPTNLPHVHIGRGGEILYGTKGNHRLAMAKLLSTRVIPCHVHARHAQWQKIREAILSDVALTEGGGEPANAYRKFRGHPDLADLYYPNQ